MKRRDIGLRENETDLEESKHHAIVQPLPTLRRREKSAALLTLNRHPTQTPFF